MRTKKRPCTLRRISEEWLLSRRFEVKESTIANYRYFLKHYLIPELGRYRTDQLDSERIRRYSEELEGKHLHPSTIGKALVILGMIQKYAGKQGYAVAERDEIRIPQKRKKNVSILTEEEQERLMEYLLREDSPLRPGIRAGILLSFCTGIRIGEVCALKWRDLDLERGILSVEKTLSRIYMEKEQNGKKTRISISDPKTENSRREIPLPGFLMEELNKIRSERYKSREYYVLTGTPWPMEPRTYSYHFDKVRRELGLEKCNYHMLRHTFATKCVETGFDLKSLSEILGHSNVSTTMNLYAHPTMRMKRDYMEKLTSSLFSVSLRSLH
ncbi:MAG: site-specific integrase [Stomatobaculum sp.]|nr:site-specific integrase [Stomatobaculum sp.]